jgi:uncharacterized membrane protein
VGVNLGTVERVIRGAIGAILIAVGVFVVKGILGIVLGLIGAVLVFSAFVGFCHVKKFFGIGTSKKAQR